MRIAQVAPLCESVPPQLYGGTERVVSFLAEELVRQGHDVTLFASGDSRTLGTLVPSCDRALRLAGCQDFVSPHLVMLEDVARQAASFDIIHYHIAPLHFPLVRRMPEAPHVTTLHGRLDLPELVQLFREYDDVPVVSISEAQQQPVPWAAWVGTIYHGLPSDLFTFNPDPDDYLAFLGRISPEKRLDRAIAIAVACGMRLRVAAKVDAADAAYFSREILPLLDHALVEFIGEIDETTKNAFLGQARALLFPIDWPEPFGLVMIEALACGCPVVAFRGGAVEEVLEEDVTGFIVDDLDGAIAAARRIDQLARGACRASFERRFTVSRMAARYVSLYHRLAATTTNRVA